MIPSPRPPKKPSRYLGISCLIAGAVCLFDPFIGVFDVLPDALGYLFLTLGFYRLSDLDDRLGDVARAAARLALLGVARFVAMLLTFGLVSPDEQPVFMLLALFTLGVLDLIILIPMWQNFSGGMTYLAARAEGTALLDRRVGNRLHVKNVTERYASFSVLYFVIREAMAILPELTVLTHQKGGLDWGGSPLYDFVGLFRLAGFAVSLLLGTVWLVKTVLLVRRMKRDAVMMDNLRRRYETEILTRHELFAMRAVKASLVALAVAAVLSLDFYMEGVNILPDFLAAAALCAAVGFLRRYVGRTPIARAAVACSVLYGVTALCAWLLQFRYFSFNDIRLIDEDQAIRDRWTTATAVQFLSAALGAAAFLLILVSLYRLSRRYTGLRALHEGGTYAADRTEAIHHAIRKKLVVVGLLAVLAAVSTVLHWGVIPTLPPIDFVGRPTGAEAFVLMLYDGLREAYWLPDLVIGGFLVGMTIHAGSEIFEQMDYSYMMN